MGLDTDINLKWIHGISKPQKLTIIAGNRVLVRPCEIGSGYKMH